MDESLIEPHESIAININYKIPNQLQVWSTTQLLFCNWNFKNELVKWIIVKWIKGRQYRMLGWASLLLTEDFKAVEGRGQWKNINCETMLKNTWFFMLLIQREKPIIKLMWWRGMEITRLQGLIILENYIEVEHCQHTSS